MELSKLQQHIRTLVTLEESEALVISCYLNVEVGLPGCHNAFAERLPAAQVEARHRKRGLRKEKITAAERS